MLNSCSGDDEDILFVGDSYQNILQYIDENDNEYSRFRQLIKAGRMEDALSSYNSHFGGSNYSLFLPDNNAVDRFITENSFFNSFDELLSDTVYVRSLVKYHVLNRQIISADFPNGALDATTLSNDFLTVNFSVGEGGAIGYKINNEASVITENILKSNGVIHVIDRMLSPVVYTAYDWVQNNRSFGYQIFADLLEITGMQDTLNYSVTDALGNITYPGYTLFVESDELYNQNGIFSLDDLIDKVSPSSSDYQASTNALNQFAKYHVLESQVYLDQFAHTNYNTFGDFPVSVRFDDNDLVFNVGTQVFETVIQGEDTLDINFLELDISMSNIVTKTGPIHQLNRILYPFRPGLVTLDLDFYNEPIINALRNTEGTFSLRREDLSLISFTGTDFIQYTKSNTSIDDVTNNDYITINGNFDFRYQTPRILSGTYELRLTANRGSSANAMVQVYLNDEKVGGIVDFTSASASATRPFYPYFLLGIVNFDQTQTQQISIRTLKPGRMQLDRLSLVPVSN